ncbi:MAG: MBL fold metallo-hydrolase [Planctomycetes bacterium]|nr:MBL fold metallo-hydrolase [Planctomycetota bacterium]
MDLTVLGSGTSVPVPDRFPAGYLVEHGDHRVMVDCGPGTLRRLAQANVTPAELDAVLLTHYHTDHCADLAALLFALRSPHLSHRPPLRIYGAPGLRRLVAKLTEAWPWLEPKDYELELVEWLPGTRTAHGFEITAVPIRHTAQSLGYRLRTEAGAVALSGDADTCDELVELARDVDLFVCDTAAPDEAKIEGHLTPGLAGGYAERAGARALVMTHFYPECDGVDLHAQARARFAGDVIAATDLLRLPIGRGTPMTRRP